MSDITEEAPAVVPDTPTPADTEAEVDYRKRYEDLQPEYTRTTQALASERSIWEDEQAALARFQEKFPHLVVGDDDDEDYDEPNEDEPQTSTDPRVDDLAKWQQTVEADRARDRYDKDFKAEVGDREVPEIGRDWIETQTLANGGNREALTAAIAKWIEFEDSSAPAKRKRAPHVPARGSAPSDKDPADMTREEHNQMMVDRLNAEEA